MLLPIDRNPSPRKLAGFALGWFAGWVVVALLLAARQQWNWAAVVLVVAAGIPLVASLVPGGLRRVYLAVTYAGLPVGTVIGLTLLAMVYFLVLTPIGLVLRITGYDPLQLSARVKRRDSLWEERPDLLDPPDASSVQRYFRQF